MSRELIKQLKTLKSGEVNPRAEWLTSNRELLLSQIKNTLPAEKVTVNKSDKNFWSTMSIFMPKQVVFNVLRPAMVLTIIFSVVTSGWISTVDAAYEALPGDWLYPAKRATENARMTVATVLQDKKEETKLHVEYAKRRAQETKKIISNPSKKDQVAQSVADLKDEMKQAGAKLDEIKNDNKQEMPASVAKEVSQNAEQIKTVLQDMKDNLLQSTTTADAVLSAQLSEAKDMVKDTAVKTAEVIITKHIEGNGNVSKEDVAEVIDKTLQIAAQEISTSKQNTEGVNKVVDAVKIEMKDLAQDPAVKQNPESASTTKNLNAQIAAVATEVKDAAEKTQAVTAETDKKISEVKELVTAGDLTKVIDMVKEVTDASKEVEKLTDQTLKNVQIVLPIVSVVKEGVMTSVSSTIKVIVTSTPADQINTAPTCTSTTCTSTATGTPVVVPVVVPVPVQVINPAILAPVIKPIVSGTLPTLLKN